MVDKVLDDCFKENEPKLYSEFSLILYSSFFSIFLGSCFYAYNLYKLERKSKAFIIIIISLLLTGLIFYVLAQFGLQLYPYQVLTHCIISFIVYPLLWKSQIGKIEFKKRKIIFPIIITIILITIMIMTKEKMNRNSYIAPDSSSFM